MNDNIILVNPVVQTHEAIKYITTNAEKVRWFLNKDYIQAKEDGRIIFSHSELGRKYI